MTRTKPRPGFPDRKISETFLHFAEPLFDAIRSHATPPQVNQALKVAFTVWNAVVFEDANGDSWAMDMLHSTIGENRELAAFVDELIARKRNLFGDDHRLVGKFELIQEGREWRLRVDACDLQSAK